MQTASNPVTSNFKRHSFELKFASLHEHGPQTPIGKVIACVSERRLTSYSAELP